MKTEPVALVPLQRHQVLDWTLQSLEGQSDMCAQVADRLRAGPFRAFVMARNEPGRVVPIEFAYSDGIGMAGPEKMLEQVFARMAKRYPGILVVEDDLQRRSGGTPWIEGASFIRDRVFRWHDMEGSPAELVRLVRDGASCYPLNAFVCENEGGRTFHLGSGAVNDRTVSQLANAVRVVVHAAYDGESLIVITLDSKSRECVERVARGSWFHSLMKRWITPPTAPQSTDSFDDRISSIFDQAAKALPPGAIDQAWQLVEHDEMPDGLCELAWTITSEGVLVPAAVVDEIEDCAELIGYSDNLPPNLRDFAKPEGETR